MNFLYKLEKKFGRFAIKNISLVLIICYAIGYGIEFIAPNVLNYLTLDPYAIVHGQVWRIISWIIIPPPQGNLFFVIISLLFYYSIGTSLERTWGCFQYNLYLFSGMVFTIAGSFLMMAFCYIFKGDQLLVIAEGVADGEALYFRSLSYVFSTYYINMSIYLAYATTFPDNVVLLMFIIPIKIKWLAIAYAVLLVMEIVTGIQSSQFGFVYPFAIGSSLLNFLLFFVTTRRYVVKNKTQRNFNKKIRDVRKEERKSVYPNAVKHRCALCGVTDKDNPDMTFRYCSKCNGNFEFCEDHIYTHIHKE